MTIFDKSFYRIFQDSSSAQATKTQYIANKNDLLALSCLVQGNPLELTQISWKFNGKPITADSRFVLQLEKPNRAVLTLNTIRDVDDGNFTCTVANGIGSEAHARLC